MTTNIRINDILFDEVTGELFRSSDGKTVRIARLSPQPRELLKLLVAHHPEVTTHEMIQRTLWPGTPANFEKNMHFCVRKIRSAFGDAASESNYFVTIPRCGYRFAEGSEIEAVTPVTIKNQEDEAAAESCDGPGPVTPEGAPVGTPGSAFVNARTKSIVTTVIAQSQKWTVMFIVVLALAWLFHWLGSTRLHNETPIRVAIMGFEPTSSVSVKLQTNDIAELLVDRLTNHQHQKFHVIGPTTTSEFDRRPQALSALVKAHSIDYMINGRFLSRDQDHVLAEIIRASDAKHVWVSKIQWRKDQVRAANVVADGFLQATNHNALVQPSNPEHAAD